MVDSSRHDHQIALLQSDTHPIVVFTAHIEVSTTTEDVSDLLVLVQVLVEEVLDLLFVARQCCWADLNLVSVLVLSLLSDAIYGIEIIWKLVVLNAEGREICWID